MKEILLSLLILPCLYDATGQKVDKTKVTYELDMLPSNIISKDRKFDVLIEYDYEAKVEAANAEIAAKKIDAIKQKEEYEKQSLGSKMANKVLLGETKPTGQYTNTKFIPTIFSEDEIKATINIPGYDKIVGAKGTVTAKFFELNFSLDETKTKVTYFPLKVLLKVTNDKGEITFQGEVPNNMNTTTTAVPSDPKLLPSTLKGCEASAKNQAISNLNAYLKREYGFNFIKDERVFFDVKDKKMTYPEYHEAVEKIKAAFIFCNVPHRQEDMFAKLKEAISIWEKTLMQLDKSNESARINKDIAAATYLNIAEACIWTRDFDKSLNSLSSYKELGEDYSRSFNSISSFLKDYSERYSKYIAY